MFLFFFFLFNHRNNQYSLFFVRIFFVVVGLISIARIVFKQKKSFQYAYQVILMNELSKQFDEKNTYDFPFISCFFSAFQCISCQTVVYIAIFCFGQVYLVWFFFPIYKCSMCISLFCFI